jgi:hypothetical protein
MGLTIALLFGVFISYRIAKYSQEQGYYFYKSFVMMLMLWSAASFYIYFKFFYLK